MTLLANPPRPTIVIENTAREGGFMLLPLQSPNESHEDWDEREALLLNQAVEKLVRYGRLVGVTPEEMISLLDSGINVRVCWHSWPRKAPEPRR
jgi:hypothetical protein